jgi:hypothetical protein
VPSKRAKQDLSQLTPAALEGLRERSSKRLTPEDAELLTSLVAAFLLLSRLVKEGRTTLKRIRRLFGLSTSEKTRDVFPNDAGATPQNRDGAAPSSPAPPAAEDGSGEYTDGSADHAPEKGSATKPDSDKPRKGHGRLGSSEYKTAERVFVAHEDLAAGCKCPDCDQAALYELSQPSPWLRLFGQALLIAKCWDCQQLRCGGCGKVFTAKPPPEAHGPKFSESAASALALVHFGLGTPLYRIERFQGALGTPVPDATQWDVLHSRALELYPAYKHLLHCAAQAPELFADDTCMPVLQFMGKRRQKLRERDKLPRPDRTGLFTTGIVAKTPEGEIALFITGRRHAGEKLDALLERRAKELDPPLVMFDGLQHNVPKNHPVRESNCLAHGRRGIVDEAENFPEQCQHVLEQIREVYAVEKACKQEGLSAQARLWMHQLVSAPTMAQLRAWMTEQMEQRNVEPNSDLGRAFKYLLKRWDKLTVFLRVPGAPIDNNTSERLLKLPVLLRKAAMFYRSERGAVVGDIYMSLIRTATMHGQNPFDYLMALMTHCSAVAEAPERWMPWNYSQTLAELSASAEQAPSASPTELPTAATIDAAAATATAQEPPSSPSDGPQPTAAAPTPATSPKPKRALRRTKRDLEPPPAFVLASLLCLFVPLAVAFGSPALHVEAVQALDAVEQTSPNAHSRSAPAPLREVACTQQVPVAIIAADGRRRLPQRVTHKAVSLQPVLTGSIGANQRAPPRKAAGR